MAHSFWPNLDPPTRTCRYCGRSLDESRYSMWVADGHALRGQQADSPTCNECLVERSARSAIPLFMGALGEWKRDAACDSPDTDPELFFPRSREKLQEAAWAPLCASCPVRDACGEFGRQTRSVGVWGGEWLGEFDGAGEDGPGAKLLLAGRCKQGHPVDSLDDITVVKSAKGATGYAGACKKCRLERSQKWRKAAGHDQYAKEWASRKKLTPAQAEANKAAKAAAARKQQALRKKLAKQVAPRAMPVVSSVQRLLDAGRCCNGHPLASQNDLYVTENPNSPGGISARCRKCHLDRVKAARKSKREPASSGPRATSNTVR